MGTTTTNLALYKPALDETGWSNNVNANFDTIDSGLSATFITQTPSSTLPNEQALSDLATGLLKNTTSTGVLSIAAAGTDFIAPANIDTFAELNTVVADKTLVNLEDGAAWLGAHDFSGAASLALPVSAAPVTDATGEIALDTSITDHTPLVQYYDGTQNMTVIAIPTADLTATDTHIIKYDAVSNKFTMGTNPTTLTQLTADLDANGFDIQFDDNTGIRDDSDNETLIFRKAVSAVNYLEVYNSATTNAVAIKAAGSDADIDIDLTPKGNGKVNIGGSTSTLVFTSGATTDGAVSKSITIEDPTATEDIGFWYTDFAFTITKVTIVLVGSATPSLTVDIRHHTDRSNAGNALITAPTASTQAGNNAETTGHIITTFNDATVLADSFIWIETDAQSGTVDEVTITIDGYRTE